MAGKAVVEMEVGKAVVEMVVGMDMEGEQAEKVDKALAVVAKEMVADKVVVVGKAVEADKAAGTPNKDNAMAASTHLGCYKADGKSRSLWKHVDS